VSILSVYKRFDILTLFQALFGSILSVYKPIFEILHFYCYFTSILFCFLREAAKLDGAIVVRWLPSIQLLLSTGWRSTTLPFIHSWLPWWNHIWRLDWMWWADTLFPQIPWPRSWTHYIITYGFMRRSSLHSFPPIKIQRPDHGCHCCCEIWYSAENSVWIWLPPS
jgi:hypothetical protein